jgi:hypothetical protein
VHGRVHRRTFLNVFSNIKQSMTQGFQDKKLEKQRESSPSATWFRGAGVHCRARHLRHSRRRRCGLPAVPVKLSQKMFWVAQVGLADLSLAFWQASQPRPTCAKARSAPSPLAGELTLWQLNHVSSLPSYGMRDHVTMLKTMTDKAGVNNLMTNVLTAMSKEQKAAMDEQVRCRGVRACVYAWGN